MKKELVVFCGFQDWANTCGSWARAIRDQSEKFDARCIMRDAHPFGYDQDIVLGAPMGGEGEAKGYSSPSEISDLINSATWYVHGGDSKYESWKYYSDLIGQDIFKSGKQLGVWHCGSRYRKKYIRYNLKDWYRGLDRRFIAYDLIRFARNSRRSAAAPHNSMDREDFKHFEKADVITISHSPSKASNITRKGTHFFLGAIEDLKQRGLKFEVDLISGVSNEECIARRGKSHIFFDQINDAGGIGTSTIEAAATGVVVVAAYHNISAATQAETGGPWPVVSAHDQESLANQLERLITDPQLLAQTAQATDEWFDRTFSRKAVAAYFDRAFSMEAGR